MQFRGEVVYIFIFIIFYFYYYFIYLVSLTFFMANHLGLDESVSWTVGEWDAVHECSTPVGAPGRVTQIEHHDSVSFLSHSWLIRF